MQISVRKTMDKYNENKLQYIIGNRRNGGKIVRPNT